MTYTLINAVFLVPAAGLMWLAVRRARVSWIGFGLCAAALIVLTVVFDNLMIAAGLFYYDQAQTSGLTVGLMPVEDLGYVMFTAVALPALWELLGGPHEAPRPGRGAR